MTRIVTDATPWLAYFASEKCVPLELALASGAVSIPPLVQTELLGNYLSVTHRKQLHDLLQPLTLTSLHAEHWARAGLLKSQLAERGFHLSARDAHVVQCAIDQQAVLLSSDPLLAQIQKYSGVTVQLW